MNLLQIQDAIVAAFKTYWTYSVVAWPNLDFDSKLVEEWVRISFIPSDSLQKSMGGATNVHRQFGSVIVEIYVDQNSGGRRSTELADLAINFFHSSALSGITFQSPDTIHIGDVDRWYQRDVSCDLYSDNNF